MGLYDRDYMREDEPAYRRRSPGAPWSPTIVLLVILGVVFVAHGIVANLAGIPWMIFLGFTSGGDHLPLDPMTKNFALSLAGVEDGRFWQLLTFQFLHGNLLHLALNGITLYNFGRFMEQFIGRGKFLTLYFLSGIAGGLLQVAATWLLHQPPTNPVDRKSVV